MTSLTAAVKAEAHRLGFELAGVTTPDPPPHVYVYETWLAAGRHAGMEYLAAPRARVSRADPRQLMPGCRSILVLGIRYWAPNAAAPQPGHGRVAAYAWGDDYHDVLPERMRRLVQFIEAQAGQAVAHRIYTDTGPLLERDLAQRAGLGWIGKNTCLIHPRQGSYFFLAEILLDIELQPDPPFEHDHCGSCRRCIEACPTGCILPDRTLDASRCISYLTIELRGEIPPGLRPHLGDMVFGCDICQQVCPWNLRFAAPQGDPAFAPRPGVPAPLLEAEAAIDQEGFSRKFRRSPVKRAKHQGYLRNIAAAIQNMTDPQ